MDDLSNREVTGFKGGGPEGGGQTECVRHDQRKRKCFFYVYKNAESFLKITETLNFHQCQQLSKEVQRFKKMSAKIICYYAFPYICITLLSCFVKST